MPKFSVIVPIYNVENYIEECIESILNQTYRDFELLCIDDCGTDSSIAKLKELTKDDERVKILVHERNKGLSEARNTGIAHAKGEFVVFIDSDDAVAPTLLEKVYAGFLKSGCESVWYNAYIMHETVQITKDLFSASLFPNDKEGYFEVTNENINMSADYAWNKAYRLDTIKRLNLKFPAGLYFEDSPFYIKAFTRIKRIYYLFDKLYYYRVRANSIVTSLSNVDKKSRDLYLTIEDVYDYLQENNLFEEYKNVVLEMIVLRIYSVLKENQRENVVRAVSSLLKKIKFPEAYLDLKKSDL